MRVARVFGPVALQGAEVIRVAEFLAQLLKDRPVPLLALGPERLREMSLQVGYDPIAVEQGVIDVEQEHDRGKLRHPETSLGSGLCQQPSAAMSTSASFGPQLPVSYGWVRWWVLRTGRPPPRRPQPRPHG